VGEDDDWIPDQVGNDKGGWIPFLGYANTRRTRYSSVTESISLTIEQAGRPVHQTETDSKKTIIVVGVDSPTCGYRFGPV